ncbi:hypothetical protein MPSEU_000781000 [Mayamaea pseudoterrestris]|nr:hypothetical protein MPSEU_000781000 [Mayamaea pseudoterrestris]
MTTRLALLLVLTPNLASFFVTAQTIAPTPAGTQLPGTLVPTAIGTVVQTTLIPTAAATSVATTMLTPTTMSPTTDAPYATRTPTTSPPPTRSLGREECNICGEGTDNMIGEPNAVVNFPDPDEPETMRRFPCESVQKLVNTRNVYRREDVCSYIFTYTYATCRCTTLEGDLLSDVLAPTVAPEDNGDGAPQNGSPSNGSGGNGSGSGSDGGDSGASFFGTVASATLVTAAALAFVAL